jgi:hypothetical protein
VDSSALPTAFSSRRAFSVYSDSCIFEKLVREVFVLFVRRAVQCGCVHACIFFVEFLRKSFVNENYVFMVEFKCRLVDYDMCMLGGVDRVEKYGNSRPASSSYSLAHSSNIVRPAVRCASSRSAMVSSARVVNHHHMALEEPRAFFSNDKANKLNLPQTHLHQQRLNSCECSPLNRRTRTLPTATLQ